MIPARGKGLCPTDLAIALPSGVYGRVAPRSGLAWKNSIDVGAGVIDEDYRGNGHKTHTLDASERASACIRNNNKREHLAHESPSFSSLFVFQLASSSSITAMSTSM